MLTYSRHQMARIKIMSDATGGHARWTLKSAIDSGPCMDNSHGRGNPCMEYSCSDH